ncbi:MAG: hypothetical protein LBU78_04005 [Microbacterium sp.]|jgi:hypothetical protein|nr:hypothetical protein [Microbacterium sp.]
MNRASWMRAWLTPDPISRCAVSPAAVESMPLRRQVMAPVPAALLTVAPPVRA